MNEPTTPTATDAAITFLENLLGEIHGLREKADNQKYFIDMMVMSLAIHQMRHGPLDRSNPGEAWAKLSELQNQRRLIADHAGEAYLDNQSLTSELFAATTI